MSILLLVPKGFRVGQYLEFNLAILMIEIRYNVKKFNYQLSTSNLVSKNL